jgi:hypothetical protein
MKKIILVSSMVLASGAFADSAIVDSIKNGKVSGNVRAYNIVWDKKAAQDQQAFALGVKLHAENAAIMGFNFGLTFNSVDDMTLVSKDTTKRDTKYINYATSPRNFAVLSESYLNYNGFGFNVRTGAQEVDTPFIKPSDAHIIPATVTGHTLNYTGVENLKVSAMMLDKFKGRNASTFAPVESLYGATKGTSGVTIGGADYTTKEMKATAYYYGFKDVMNLMYAAGGYTIGVREGLAVTPSLQYASEKASGEKYGGEIGSSVMGANVNVTSGDLKVDVAYVTVKEDSAKANKGAFYSRMTYFTDALYTNSMAHGMALSNGDTETNKVGSSYKVTLNYAINSELSTKLSYAKYDYKEYAATTNDRAETDWDFTYKISSIPGLSFTNRVGMITSDNDAKASTQVRSQIQMTF